MVTRLAQSDPRGRRSSLTRPTSHCGGGCLHRYAPGYPLASASKHRSRPFSLTGTFRAAVLFFIAQCKVRQKGCFRSVRIPPLVSSETRVLPPPTRGFLYARRSFPRWKIGCFRILCLAGLITECTGGMTRSFSFYLTWIRTPPVALPLFFLPRCLTRGVQAKENCLRPTHKGAK